MQATGFKATVSSGPGKSISRTSFHPENALATLQEWIDKQIQFADKHNIEISWEIVAVEGKVMGQENA